MSGHTHFRQMEVDLKRVRSRFGTGSPNSVVTGKIGEKYVQTDAATGNTIWVKETGDNTNTGWVNYANSPGTVFFRGSGTPEGAVTAPVGSVYQRSNGGAGTSIYVKETGAGNTGWVAYVSATAVAALVQTGAGTPEAAVTAPVGTLFLRTNGGASTTLYVKESGAGNTGWVAK
jgi:hypothetical protein